jgi:cell division septation protein DedD
LCTQDDKFPDLPARRIAVRHCRAAGRLQQHAEEGAAADTIDATVVRQVLQGRRARREPAGQSRRHCGCGAAAGAAQPLRQPAIYGARQGLRARHVAASVQGTRHRFLVRPQVPRSEDVHRRDLRHVRDDGGASDLAAALLRARDQCRDRQERRRARQRPGPFLHDRVIDLSYAAANRIGTAAKGSGEVIVEAIIPGERTTVAAAPLPPVVATAPLRTGEAPQVAAVSTETSGGFAVQLGAFQNYNNAQSFLAHVQGPLTTAQVEPKVREAGGLYRVYVGPYPDRDAAKQVAERLTSAFGFATAVAPH